MILLKSALSSILVFLGACSRAAEGGPSAPTPSVTATESATVSTVAVTSAPSAQSADRNATPHAAVKPTAGWARDAAKTVYVCPMHPEVVSDTPGLCPKCNMKLAPKPTATEVRQKEDRLASLQLAAIEAELLRRSEAGT